MSINLPTKITLSRIFAIPVMVVLFYVEFSFHYLTAGIVFILAAITDTIDGKLARKLNQVTVLGKLLDPIADKVLALFAMIMEVVAGMMYFHPAGVICVAVIVSREILVGAFRTIAASRGEILAADSLGKLKTIFTNIALPTIMIAGSFENVFGFIVNIIGNILFSVATILTVVSGVNYIVKNRHVFEQDK